MLREPVRRPSECTKILIRSLLVSHFLCTIIEPFINMQVCCH